MEPAPAVPARPAAPRVRSLERRDRDAWAQLWDGYLRFYRAGLAAPTTESAFERLCDRSGGLAGLVVTDDRDVPIGLAHLIFHPSTWDTAGSCYLQDLYVGRGDRGRAASAALFAAVYAEADARGVAHVYWHTQAYNGVARSLYDQVGHPTSFIVYER